MSGEASSEIAGEGAGELAADTSTTSGARAHARAQAGSSARGAPTGPGVDAVDLPDGVSGDDVVWDETLGAGDYAARRIDRHTRLRLVDLEGDACVNFLVYNAEQPIERLNVADTVKVQWQAYLGEKSLLLSDMGRVLMSVTVNEGAEHDTLCGASSARHNDARYHDGANHGAHPSARDRFSLAVAKHGLGPVDIPANVNFFKSVRVDEDGTLRWVDDASRPGAFVELRAEMDVLVVAANTPHVLDPRAAYVATDVRMLGYRGAPTAVDDPCRRSGPEAERAFLNTDEYYRR